MNNRFSPSLVAAGCAALGMLALSAAPVSAQTNREKYTVDARLTDRAPRLDGILDEPAWQTAAVLDQFIQQEPRIGEPATERTEVRVMYDSRHLYVAVHAFDTNPSGIVATEMRRDSDRLLSEDSFQLIVDTFSDSRNGY